MEAIGAAYPTSYGESMNTVLAQEAIRYNALLAVIDSRLKSSLKALRGLVVMSPDLEAVANSLYDNQVCGRAHEMAIERGLSLWSGTCCGTYCGLTIALQRQHLIVSWVALINACTHPT